MAASPDRPLNRREDIFEAVAIAAERFLGGDSFDAALTETLARLGEASASSRVALIEHMTGRDGAHMRPRAEWKVPDIPKLVRTDLDGLPYFPRWAATTGARIDRGRRPKSMRCAPPRGSSAPRSARPTSARRSGDGTASSRRSEPRRRCWSRRTGSTDGSPGVWPTTSATSLRSSMGGPSVAPG